jgi:Domain of unknown function (DUF222)
MLSELVQDVEELAGRVVGLMPDGEVSATYLALRREIDRLEACAGRLLATLHHRVIPAGDGASSTPVWVQWQTGQRVSEAKAALATAIGCKSLPLAQKAWVQGEISTSAARTIAQGRRAGHEDVYAEIEDLLVDFASRREFHALDAAIRHYHVRADALDDRDPADLNGVHLSRVGARWALHGDLDELVGQRVDEALRAAADPPLPEDDRTPAKRFCRRADRVRGFFLDHADRPVEGGERPHVSVQFNWETIASGEPATLPATPLLRSTIDRLLCDARISRVLMGAAGLPLDVGRARYTPNRAQRRAAMMRDGRCGSPAVTEDRRGPKCITSCPGSAAVQPISRTSRACARSTTISCTNRVGARRSTVRRSR